MRRLTIYSSVILVALVLAAGAFWYGRQSRTSARADRPSQSQVPTPTPVAIPISDGFDYPFGNSKASTKAKDGDGWYNAQDFGENNHLGEDWNKETGGSSDCGLPVYAVSKGTIIFAGEAGPGWGKVIIVRHSLPGGTLVETLYGHLKALTKTGGDVERREQIGNIGDADGVYPCHLHFELRLSDCPFWGEIGPGYSTTRAGWTDPSNFLDARRKLSD